MRSHSTARWEFCQITMAALATDTQSVMSQSIQRLRLVSFMVLANDARKRISRCQNIKGSVLERKANEGISHCLPTRRYRRANLEGSQSDFRPSFARGRRHCFSQSILKLKTPYSWRTYS